MAKRKKARRRTTAPKLKKQLSELEEKIDEGLSRLQEARQGCLCFPFLGVDIAPSVVDDIFDDLRTKYDECDGRLGVLVDSAGGDIDAAYNLSMLFRKYGHKHLSFIVPRWAKSAATLLVLSGDEILMSPVAELGPLDPQIRVYNPLEGRLEQFSPLHIENALDMIRHEFDEGNEKLARGLLERLQFPLTLGGFLKYHEIGEQYLIKLLQTRMFAGSKEERDAETIARRLTKGYANHGFCINVDEAKSMGLNAVELTGEQLDVVWEVHRLTKEKENLEKQIRADKLMETIKQLPPELLEGLPAELLEKLPKPIQEQLGLQGS